MGKNTQMHVGLVKINSSVLNSELNWSFKYFCNDCKRCIYSEPKCCIWAHKRYEKFSEIKYL